jgi:hypothetical protein
MGMPISTYTILRSLGSRTRVRSGFESYALDTALKSVEPFNLFAFIIHDPVVHSEFNTRLNTGFDEFDYVTGDKLLFFALVDPPSNWLAHAGGRSYVKELRSFEAQELRSPQSAINSADKSLTAFALAHFLTIPSDMLPCIVVTHNFCSRHFLWFKTCPNHVEEQLKKLGYLAARLPPKLNTPSGQSYPWVDEQRALQFQQQVRVEDLDLCDGNGIESLNITLAKALSDILAFIVARSGSSSGKDIAARQAAATLKRLYEKLRAIKQETEKEQTESEIESEVVEKLYLDIAAYLSQLNTATTLDITNIVSIDPDVLEVDSYHILRTGCKVLEALNSNQDATLDLICNERVDFAPGVICLCKVFEKEMNLSIAHWMRKEKGITLPRFYNKEQPGIRARIGATDLNRGDENGRWRPLMLGEGENACRTLTKTCRPPSWTQSQLECLMENWKTIRVERNEAAHVTMVGQDSANAVCDSLNVLAKDKIFDLLYGLKTELRGP